ncbi:2-oxo acid dehydrogenase subunit E2 [Horticoccus sp. 23ND18S-11]|uniref:2-oxo acid dehydrogenase subunit E2 n=1 Tax=Horticoccus sp. 23ND18S-11 TaxID=3391832 RepID=UPI0039C99D39
MTQPVRIPHEQVNDQSVLLVEWLVADGNEVKVGQPVAVIETSKSTAEVEAPAAGFLRHGATAGKELPVGAVFCHVTSARDEIISESSISPPASESIVTPMAEQDRASAPAGDVRAALPSADVEAELFQPVFSEKAKILIKQQGLSLDRFARIRFVREADVLAVVSGKVPMPRPATNSPGPNNVAPMQAAGKAAPVPAAGVALRSEDLSRAKRVEIRYLQTGAENTLPSVVTVPYSTAGLKKAAEQLAAGGGGGTAVIIYELARLLRKYPVFNAYYGNGQVHYYDQVNIGLAVDGGLGLKVPVIFDADKKGLPEIADAISELLLDYVNDSLPVARLAGGTFTITDLSSEGVTAFHPLINQGQSAILGVGAEMPGAPTADGQANLIMAFDHQLAEGRSAARMLGELRDRLKSYQDAGSSQTRAEQSCGRCERLLHDLQQARIPVVEEVRGDGSRRLICRSCILGVST